MFMRKIILALIGSVCLLWSSQSYAQEEHRTLKDLAIEAMQEYGVALYDRDNDPYNYEEAARVFERILMYDPANRVARHYLELIRAKGFNVNIPPMPAAPGRRKAAGRLRWANRSR